MEKTPVIILKSLNVNRGGVTKAAIKRANLYAEKYPNVIILTTNFQINHKLIIDKLYEKELSKKVKVYNFFEYYRMTTKNIRPKNKHIHKVNERGFDVVRMEERSGYSYRYYKEGVYKKYKKYNNDKKLNFIDYREHGFLRNKREEYDNTGRLVRTRHVDTRNNNYILDVYYGMNNECVLTVHLSSSTGEEGNVVYFGKENKLYKSLKDMQKEWVNLILSKYQNVILIGEQRYHDYILYDIDKSVKTVFVVHSNHLLSPYTDNTKPSPAYKKLLSMKDKINRIVVLTEEQKEDMNLVASMGEKIEVIPHAWNEGKGLNENIKRNPNKVVMVARYVIDKRVDHAIRSFEEVVKVLPSSKLEIFGKGPLKSELQKLINKKGLSENVYLKGYTDNVHKEYASAMCSIITSRREGFGMVITESLASGSPVIAYNFKYGPKDIITNNENGIIVEKDNISDLSQAILKVLTEPKLQRKLSEKALETRTSFSEDDYKKRWLKLIEEL